MRARGTVSGSLVRLFLEQLQARGLPVPDEAIEAARHPRRRHSASALRGMWDRLQGLDPRLGLHLGGLQGPLPTGHVLFAVMANSPTLAEAMACFCRYHAIMGDLVQPVLDEADDVLTVRWEPRPRGQPVHAQHSECIAAAVVSVLRQLALAVPVEVWFRHAAPDDVGEHERILGCCPRFGAVLDCVRVPRLAADVPLAHADPELLVLLLPHAERRLAEATHSPAWTARVVQLLRRDLPQSRVSLASTARALNISTRSLQSYLHDEGTTFQQVLDEVRGELARSLLRDADFGLADIAFVLGYSDQSAFTRAFHRWTGTSPLAWRRAQAG